MEFTQKILAQDRVRILGICFGHQIVGRALGAKVGRNDLGWEVAVCDMDLTDKGKQLFGLEKIVCRVSLLIDCRANILINSGFNNRIRMLFLIVRQMLLF